MAKSCKIPQSKWVLRDDQWRNGRKAAADICEHRNVPMRVICSSAKAAKIVSVRDEIIALLHGRGWSTTQIGNLLCKNHSMVVYALQRIKKAGLPRPDGVHLGHDNQTERQDDSGRGVDSDGVRNGGGDLGGSDEQQPAHSDREDRCPSETQLHGSTGDRSGENSCSRVRRLPHRSEHDTDSQGD